MTSAAQINIDSSSKFKIPRARGPVESSDLTRPDWVKPQYRDPKLLWLDKNENTDPGLLKVTDKIRSEVDSSALFTYPDASLLYTKLAKFVGVSPENLMLTPGSDGVIRVVFETFIESGDVVIHTLPTFAMYPVYCKMYGVKAVPLEYMPSPSGPTLDIEVIISALNRFKPRLLCLPNPDSPTGTVFQPAEIRAILETAGELGTVVLIDEAYHPFYPETVAPLVDVYPHLIVARTFAKAWGLAGLRIGYAVASKEVAKLIHKVRPMYEVNTFAVHFMERMLDLEQEMRKSVDRLLEGKRYFLSKMNEFGFPVLSNHGNFLHVAFGDLSSQIHLALKNIVLYRVDFSEPCLKGFSRFSCTTKDIFERVIKPIQECTRR